MDAELGRGGGGQRRRGGPGLLLHLARRGDGAGRTERVASAGGQLSGGQL